MTRFVFLAIGILWSLMAIAGYSDHGRWYSNGSGIDTLFWGIVIVVLIIGAIYALIQKLRTDKGWQTGGCLLFVVIAILGFVAIMGNVEKNRTKESNHTNSSSTPNNLYNIEEAPTGSPTSLCPQPVEKTLKQTSKCQHCSNGIVTESQEIEVEEVCPDCKGLVEFSERTCFFCKGEGKIYNDMKKAYDKCLDCNGKGQIKETSRCNTCLSTGKIKVRKTISVHTYCAYCNGTGYIN